jgi:hypothetical protein
MKPDTHSQTVTPLSAALLHDYVHNRLGPEERQRVERLLGNDELAATAAAGFAAFPDALADVTALQAEIAARSGLSGGSAAASKSWLNWLAGGAGVAVVVVAAIAFWPHTEKPKATPPVVAAKPAATTPAEMPQEIVLNPATDNFVNPQANPVVARPIAAQPTSAPPAETQPATAPPEIQLPAATVIQPPQTTPPAEEKLREPVYNFPIRYILDLKITDFDRLYNRPLKTQKLRMTGTPANEDERRTEGGREEDYVIMADQVLREGLEAFRTQRYGRCISKFEVLLKNSPDDVNARFYMAVSYIKLEMHSKALPLLDAVIAAENNAFHEEAEWYKALALIGNGDTEQAETLLKKIAAGNTFYSKQAAEKLKTL